MMHVFFILTSPCYQAEDGSLDFVEEHSVQETPTWSKAVGTRKKALIVVSPRSDKQLYSDQL